MGPVPEHYFSENLVAPGIEPWPLDQRSLFITIVNYVIKIQAYIVKMNKEILFHSYTQMVTYIHSGANLVCNIQY
jgi:hypothetical protein